jgi:transposase
VLRAGIERECASLALVKELFAWRRFSNRRELAGCLGLAPTPYASGDSQIEQVIIKAGNHRARALLVELS